MTSPSNVPLIPAEDLRKLFGPVTAFTARLVAEARAAGALRDLPVSDMGGFIGGGIRNTLKWRRIEGSTLLPPERTAIAEMCWSVIAA